MIKFFWIPKEVWYYVVFPIFGILIFYLIFNLFYSRKKGTYYYNYVVDFVYSSLGIVFCGLLFCLLLGYSIATLQILSVNNLIKVYSLLTVILVILPIIPAGFLIYVISVFCKNLKRKEILDKNLEAEINGETIPNPDFNVKEQKIRKFDTPINFFNKNKNNNQELNDEYENKIEEFTNDKFNEKSEIENENNNYNVEHNYDNNNDSIELTEKDKEIEYNHEDLKDNDSNFTNTEDKFEYTRANIYENSYEDDYIPVKINRQKEETDNNKDEDFHIDYKPDNIINNNHKNESQPHTKKNNKKYYYNHNNKHNNYYKNNKHNNYYNKKNKNKNKNNQNQNYNNNNN